MCVGVCVCVCVEEVGGRCSPTGAAFGCHARIVLQHDVAVVIKVEESQRGQDVGYAAGRRNFRMAADGVNDALNGGVIGRIQFLVNSQKNKISQRVIDDTCNEQLLPWSTGTDSVRRSNEPRTFWAK